MAMYFVWFVFLVMLTQKSSQYTFEDYKSALLSASENEKCHNELLSMEKNLTWFKLFDASAIIPDGIMQGNLNNMGAYDECIAIDVPESDILGKYCYASIKFTELLSNVPEEEIQKLSVKVNLTKVLSQNLGHHRLRASPKSLPYNFGICLPHHCGNNSELLKNLNIDERVCSTKYTNNTMNTEAAVALYVLLAFVVVALVSTVVDVVLEKCERKPPHDILVAFSLYSNGKKLIQTSNNPNQLSCINGVKTINMIWVVFGHTYDYSSGSALDNTFDLLAWEKSYSSMFVIGSTVSVDSFFTIAGLLSVYTLLRSKYSGLWPSVKGIPLIYIHRYLRLTPAFAIVIYVHASGLINYIADGPVWYHIDEEVQVCKKAWWAALLYIQNYRGGDTCVGQSWYLSVDMQLFLASPIIWIALRQWPKHALRAMYVLVLLGFVVPFVIAISYDLPAFTLGTLNSDFGSKYYLATHVRFGPYVIGMLAGYYIFQARKKGRKNISPPALFLLWTIVVVTMYACVYAGFPLVPIDDMGSSATTNATSDPDSLQWWNALYLSLSRNLWAGATVLLIYLCVTGNGGPINWFLSSPVMQFFAKLSYCMYLTHILVIEARLFQTRVPLHFSNYEMMNQWIASFVISIPVSIIQTLLFESPMIIIEKILFGRGKPKALSPKSKVEP